MPSISGLDISCHRPTTRPTLLSRPAEFRDRRLVTVGVKKIYTKADTEACIDRADHKHFRQWRSVRSDVSNQTFASAAFKKDEGHTFRHVEGTAELGKSTYADRETAISVTMQLLNCAQGQKILARLDKADPAGSFIENDIANRKIEADITGDWYGYDGTKKKITRATCQIMKLGADVLWVQTSYPSGFVT
jgi:hypothetical protein